MAQPAAVLSILVKANTKQATTGLLRINQQLDITEAKSKKVAHAIEGVAKASALIGGAAVIGGITYATKKAADFEAQMSSLGAIADANGRQMERFRKQALKAGADTKFSASEAAQAQIELAKGGLTVRQIMRGGLKSALALAAAGEMELADAASTTVNAMKLFGLRGKQSMKVADALATAANKTTADVSDFALALQQGGSAAKTAGLSFQETVAWLETLAEAGIKGSDAGTSLKTALIQLASPSSAKARETAKKLGLEVFDTSGKMKSLTDVSKELRDSFDGLNRKQRIQAATTLVGQDGFRALLALYDAGPKKVARMQKELGKEGTAAEVAKKKQDNLKGSLEQLRGSIETLAIQVGTEFIPMIRAGADELTDFTNQVGQIFARDDLSLGEKISRAFELAKIEAQPLIDDLESAIDRANIPDHLADAISTATPIIVKAAAAGGLAAAKTFAGAFAESDVWGKLVLGGWLLSRMGGKAGFFKMGATAGGAFGSGMATGAATGFGGKIRGALGSLGALGKKFVALDVGINLVDSHGNPIAAVINTAHDLSFGIVPKVKVQTGKEKVQSVIDKDAQTIDRLIKSGNIDKLAAKIKDLKADAADSRAFGAADLAKQQEALVNKASTAINDLVGNQKKVQGMSARFADSIRGLRLKGGKDFDGLVRQVTFGSRQILKTGSENSAKTREAIDRQFDLARKRIRDHFRGPDGTVNISKQGFAALHRLAVKELALYGIGAGRVNVVLAKGANGEMRPNQRGGFQTGGKPSGDSIPSLLERGEYVINRRAVQKVGKRALDRLNFGLASRFQRGGHVGMQAGGSVTGDTDVLPGMLRALRLLSAAAHKSIFIQSGRRTLSEQAALAAEKGIFGPGNPTGAAAPSPNAPHVQGIAADVTPGRAALGALAGKFGLGFPISTEPWHIQMLNAAAAAIAAVTLPRPRLQGPASVALEAGQGAMDRVRSAAIASLNRALGSGGVNAGSAGVPASGAYTKAALRKLWVRAGGDPSVANLMAAIALAESGGIPTRMNAQGSGAAGLWQILGLPFPGNPLDPFTNARMAVAKYNSQGLGAWEAYTNGSYSQYLQKGGLAGRFGKALHTFRTAKSPKLRKGAVDKLIDRVHKVGLSGGMEKRLRRYSKDADVFGEYADRAGALGGKVGGFTQTEWLQRELEALFKWRNTLIRAEEVVRERREQVAKAIERARKRLETVNHRLRTLNKHPKQNKAAIKSLTREQNALRGRILPALTDKRSGLSTLRGDLLSNLQDVQGVGAPHGVLKRLPAVGVLGGRIFDVQMQLKDLLAPPAPVTDTDGDSERSGILQQLLTEANLRTAVSEAQFRVFQNMPQFATGGIVPGVNGQAVPALVHAGEGVFTREQMDAIGAPSVTINVAPGMEWLRQFISVEVDRSTRTQARRADRGLPGRGGGMR